MEKVIILRERKIEKYLIDKVESFKGEAYKFTSSKRGVPDRIVLLPGGRMFFAEVKAPGETPSPLQNKRIRDLRKLGFQVEVIDSRSMVDKILMDVME